MTRTHTPPPTRGGGHLAGNLHLLPNDTAEYRLMCHVQGSAVSGLSVGEAALLHGGTLQELRAQLDAFSDEQGLRIMAGGLVYW